MIQSITGPEYKQIQINGDTLTPISVFNRLQGQRKFLLESLANQSEKGRFSFLGLNPFKEIIGDNHQTVINYMDTGTKQTETGNPLEIVKQHLLNHSLPLPFPFYGGGIGYIGYDAIRHYEFIGPEYHDEIEMPDIHLMFYQDVIVFDHLHQTVSIVAINLNGERTEKELNQSLEDIKHDITTDIGEPIQPLDKISFKPAIDKQTFMERVEQAKKHIVDGDIFQIVLSQRMKASFDTDPFTFYRHLRRANPSPYMFYINFDDYIVLGASPESLIKTNGRQVVTNPIAGTRPRGKTEEEDISLGDELLADEKEQAEHKMLVDLSRNDLGRVCEVGSIKIPKYMTIERYQHVMHIVSEVHGTLLPNYSGIDALASTLPAGTVSGAPKIRAMQIINELERERRGVYAGAVGYINMNGDVDLALAIRTMVVKDNNAYVQAGAGIVYDSNPAAEYDETLNKAKSLLEVNTNDFINR
ncbi:anthranilate synthase component I [Sediminibacillus albus]|uniref:Anthranilate synthase component 1 n=1 Tax=Sediminibacillus albus TaxID=407036 RepID=A0A1G8ZTD9_9BACI|nr:anthranilate synthase component I [Sediminibacillus albus]SDK18392.1 anthranilate synthase component 1 [Sediminibacillus albus]